MHMVVLGSQMGYEGRLNCRVRRNSRQLLRWYHLFLRGREMESYLWVKKALGVGHRVVLWSQRELEGRTTLEVSRHVAQEKVFRLQSLILAFTLSDLILIWYIQFIYALIFYSLYSFDYKVFSFLCFKFLIT